MNQIYSAVYRVTLESGVCRSAKALLLMKTESLEGVRASALTAEGHLVVVGDTEASVYEDLLAAVVSAGLDPVDTRISVLERLLDPKGLSLETALALGLVEPPKEPARAVPLQRIDVHVNGGYDPDTIILAAKVPAEITFSEGHECLSRVVFDSLGIEADLESGGALISLPPLDPGTYTFRCGRNMVHGKLIAE